MSTLNFDFLKFQSTTSRGGRLEETCRMPGIKHFNPRPPEEVDKIGAASFTAAVVFQSTTSRGGRPQVGHTHCHWCGFQSTTSRGGRRQRIKTHDAEQSISIHDLPRRSTYFTIIEQLYCIAFQSTTSRGGRHSLLNTGRNASFISIHDLPRRSTVIFTAKYTTAFEFQSTTSRGGRHMLQITRMYLGIFQSTTSRGGRLIQYSISTQYHTISIHDLPRRSTPGR